ncbi:VOC family protein [Oceaniglobus indicus]|uniref:VOC family protein n=1 Tax=Oceaniglobus indicus TaxID=2047749 RepID=UPI000C18AE4D|nr:VOC family protein [Oceaniglobus indicus]
MELDHLAISAATLADGAAYVENLFGVTLAPGGVHDALGTHNRLLSLGPDLYLEVIAVNPEGRAPGRPRWFDLDRFTGAPRLTNWILRCGDLPSALEQAPDGTGSIIELQRGDLRWRMAVPETGVLPLDGIAPALIEWQDGGHPAGRLPDSGCRLTSLRVCHPDVARISRAYGAIGRTEMVEGPPALEAVFETPKGRVLLTDRNTPAGGSDPAAIATSR